jgi:TrmH family RNA methyltransferase
VPQCDNGCIVGAVLALTRAQGSLVRKLLRDKKTRASEGAFVLEGTKACLDLIRRFPQSIVSVVVSPRFLSIETEADRRVRAALPARQFLCSDDDVDHLTDVEMPQGILAVVRQPRWDEAQLLGRASLLGLHGDRLQDPANVGAIIRTAAALNLSGVWLSDDSADHFAPKVVRATVGTILSLPIFRTGDVRSFLSTKCEIYSAVLASSDRVSLRSLRTRPSHLMIAVGNEGAGLDQAIVQASRVRFSIPLAEGVESLNVAATAAIAAFYFSGLPIGAQAEGRG